MKVAVIGGGAAGIGAAWNLRRASVSVVLLESGHELGGRARTAFWRGAWRIRGAAAFVGGEPDMVAFAKELDLYDENNIEDAVNEAHYAVFHAKYGYVPVDLPPLKILRSPLIPLTEKLSLGRVLPTLLRQRIVNDEADPTSALAYDEISACSFFRRYSPAFVDYMLEPIMAQYFGYGEDDYSLGWFLWTLLTPYLGTAMPWTFKERGVGRIPQEVQGRFEKDEECELLLDTHAERVTQEDDGVRVDYQSPDGTQSEMFDGVVIAVPGNRVNSIVPGLDQARRTFFEQVEYVAHDIFHVAAERPRGSFPRSVLLPTVDGFEAVSNVWLRGDDSELAIHGELKGRFSKAARGLDDDEILDEAWGEVIRGLPMLRDVTVHDRVFFRNEIGLCSRRVGFARVLSAFGSLPPLPRLAFCGDYLVNSTMGRSLRSGREAADQLIARLA